MVPELYCVQGSWWWLKALHILTAFQGPEIPQICTETVIL